MKLVRFWLKFLRSALRSSGRNDNREGCAECEGRFPLGMATEKPMLASSQREAGQGWGTRYVVGAQGEMRGFFASLRMTTKSKCNGNCRETWIV